MEDIKFLLDYVFIPFIYFMIKQNQRISDLEDKVIVLETKETTRTKTEKQINDNFKILFDKIDSLKDEIHSNKSDFVTHKQCSRF